MPAYCFGSLLVWLSLQFFCRTICSFLSSFFCFIKYSVFVILCSVELTAEELEAKRQRKLQVNDIFFSFSYCELSFLLGEPLFTVCVHFSLRFFQCQLLFHLSSLSCLINLLQVLQMLSGRGDDEPVDSNNNIKLNASVSNNDLSAAATTAMDTHTNTSSTTTASAAATASVANPVKKISIKNKLTSVPSKTTFGPTDDEEHKPVREIVKLEYTQEELSAMQSASNNYAVDNDYHTDYDFVSGKKHAAGAGAGGTVTFFVCDCTRMDCFSIYAYFICVHGGS